MDAPHTTVHFDDTTYALLHPFLSALHLVRKTTRCQYLLQRTFDVSLPLLHMFPVNQALWERLINSCMWATVYLSKDDEEFKRVIDHMEVREIETIFEKVQGRSAISKIVITKSMDSKNRWIGQVVLGEINRCWIAELPLN